MWFINENAHSHSAVLTGIRAAILDSLLVVGTSLTMFLQYRGVVISVAMTLSVNQSLPVEKKNGAAECNASARTLEINLIFHCCWPISTILHFFTVCYEK